VLITIVKNDGNWGVKDLFLDKCTVVDDQNWECRDTPFTTVYVMIHGHYYHSLTGGGLPEFVEHFGVDVLGTSLRFYRHVSRTESNRIFGTSR
jgi:hypothetical protein